MAAMLAAALLAGCTAADEPEESTELPDTEPPALATPSPTPVAAPPPAETTPPADAIDPSLIPVPPGEGVIFHPGPQPVEPAPAAPAPVEPAPEAPAQEPADAGDEGAAPDPAQADDPDPAPDNDPDPSPDTGDDDPEPDNDAGDDPEDEEAWPTEGSHVRYRVVVFESIPGSDGNDGYETYTNLSWTYRDDDWRGTCEGERYSTFDGETTRTELDERFEASDPPHWPPFNTLDVPDRGDDVEAWFVQGCDIRSLDRAFAGTDGDMYVATDYDDGSPDDFRTEWSRDWGLVDSWTWSQRNTNTRGVLTSTDAPGM